jgi:DNA-binding winged helix-turn-helix (wHTH) protein
MGGAVSAVSARSRQRRRWLFSRAVFDEADWSLLVDGRPAPIETKPLEVLRELLLRPGEVVTKEELLDAVWPTVIVVEASLSTAVRKLRRAFGNESGEDAIIETVTGLGYRLAVPVKLEFRPVQIPPSAASPTPGAGTRSHDDHAIDRLPGRRWPSRRQGMAAGTLAIALALVGGGLVAARKAPGAPALYSQRDARKALRELDLPMIEAMLRQGWNPNEPFDSEGNGALNILLNVCDWNPGHDKKELLLIARTLYDAGARVDVRNVWGDTPYSIAKEPRYCGPDHPVTVMLHKICYTGLNAPGDKCLAKRPAHH